MTDNVYELLKHSIEDDRLKAIRELGYHSSKPDEETPAQNIVKLKQILSTLNEANMQLIELELFHKAPTEKKQLNG